MNEEYKAMVQSALKDLIRENAKADAQKIFDEMKNEPAPNDVGAKKKDPRLGRKYPSRVKFPGSSMVKLNENADSMVKQFSGLLREVAEAFILIMKERHKGQSVRKADLVREVTVFLGRDSTSQHGTVSTCTTKICLAGILIIQREGF